MSRDLSDAIVRSRIQGFIDGVAGAPTAGTPDEYAALFETVYPSEADMRTYIDAKIKGGKPSYGHIAIATLMRAKLTQIEVKIHGDFRSRQLKNTLDELRLQDEKLRQILVDSCRRFGLIVVEYSG
jgi:hypothetical protein